MDKVEKNIKSVSNTGKPKNHAAKDMRTIRVYSLKRIKARKLADKLSVCRRSAQER